MNANWNIQEQYAKLLFETIPGLAMRVGDLMRCASVQWYPQSPLEESRAQYSFRGLGGPKHLFFEGHGVSFVRVLGSKDTHLLLETGGNAWPCHAWPTPQSTEDSQSTPTVSMAFEASKNN